MLEKKKILTVSTKGKESHPNHGSGPGNILLSRAMMTLSEVQCHLDRQGASNMVVELVIQNPNQQIFLRAVELGIALLEGGNPTIQQSLLSKLNISNNSERFFKLFHEKMTIAQQTIRSTVTVTTTEIIGTKRSVDESSGNSGKGRHGLLMNRSHGLVLTEELKKQISDAASATSRAYAWIKKLGVSIVSINTKKRPPKLSEAPPIITRDDGSSSDRTPLLGDDNNSDSGSVTPSKSSVRNFSQSHHSSHDNNKAQPDQLPQEVTIMRPILRLMQLLCENHNLDLQNYLRNQGNKRNYNMVSETLKFLDCICGSTTGGLGLLGLYINEKNVSLVNQTLETLTEYCQGPCHENQNCIAMHESNAIDIIIALILHDINPLGKTRMDLVLSLKNNASKLLLAIMESRSDSVNAERIMYNMSAKQLIDAAVSAYHQSLGFRGEMEDQLRSSQHNAITDMLSQSGEESETTTDEEDDDEGDEDEVTPKEVGHNIYILCHQLARHNKELALLLKPNTVHDPAASNEVNNKFNKALSYYRRHTAQIEIVRSDRTLEQIVFPVPQICEFLTPESRQKVYYTTERDEQGSKVSDFFVRSDELYNEMKWQRKLRSQRALYFISSHMSSWASISFNLQFFLNFIVALFYPFEKANLPAPDLLSSLFLFLLVFASFITFYKFRNRHSIRFVMISVILRSIFSFGIEATLIFVGIGNFLSTGIHLISIMGNRGTFTKSVIQILTDTEIIYHVTLLMFCVLGLCLHPLFYSVLLLHVVYSEETLRNVIRSVTRNGRSIILTALLAVILIYLFSILGYLFFRDDFTMEIDSLSKKEIVIGTSIDSANAELAAACDARSNGSCSSLPHEKSKYNNISNAVVEEAQKEDEPSGDNNDKERSCDTLLMCIVTTLNQGLRNGGGIGDVLRSPSAAEPLFFARVVYDLLFFFIVIIIILNLIFGVIIDTFADLRSEKQQKEEILKNSCFICGLERSSFENKTTSFEEHIRSEHSMWHYLYFIVLVRVKNPTEFTGPESYVSKMMQERNLDWFPRMRALSLDSYLNDLNDDSSGSYDQIKILQTNLELTQQLVATLSHQLSDLREQVKSSSFLSQDDLIT